MAGYRVLCVDDEELSLRRLAALCAERSAEDIVACFTDPTEALDYAAKNPVDIAFLDVDMPHLNGIILAEKLHAVHREITVVITTAYRDYAYEAYQQDCAGYLLKPIRSEDLAHRFELLSPNAGDAKENKLTVQCFGDFEVYYRQQPLHFRLNKTKELFAYLVDRRCALMENRAIMAALWEDEEHVNYFKSLRRDLVDTLAQLPFPVVTLSHGMIGLLRDALNCDYLDYLERGTPAFRGEYMEQYFWAESTKGTLMREKV